ncbi:MAG: hypothetical protein KF774_07030 [Planctomyces sp.]|nr:hypothetical protein [Planctomyces sp.]
MTKTDTTTKERRPLVAGITDTFTADPVLEKQFVYAEKPKPAEPKTPEGDGGKAQAGNAVVSRMPLTTRIRTDFGTALKRASLERQLAGVTPNTLQDILEEAVEPWLRNNGYLK